MLQDFPARHEAINQVISLIQRAHPQSRVYFSSEMLGCERLLQFVSDSFGGAQFFLSADPHSSFAWHGAALQVPFSGTTSSRSLLHFWVQLTVMNIQLYDQDS